MDWKRDCAAVIPCLNQAREIGEVVERTRALAGRVIVVDDGSTDGTAAAARAAGAETVRHACNRGKGAALRTGWRRALAEGCSWVVTLDGDGQHAPEDIPAFWKRAEAGGARLVAGNRMHEARAMPWARRAVNRWMTGRISSLAGFALADSQCGLRLMHIESLEALGTRSQRFEIESEVLAGFVRKGWRVDFVPVRVIYARGGTSRIRPVADGARWLRWWLRARDAAREREHGVASISVEENAAGFVR
jgi:glycosyltransferase involved in cell wall biosynthesis